MRTLVVSPHPDDEVLGAGGTLLKRKAAGDKIAWLIMTEMSKVNGWTEQERERRESEISRVKEFFDFDEVYRIGFPSTQLDQVPKIAIIEKVTEVFKRFEADELLIPHSSDVHSDHRVTFEVISSCTKWFRSSSLVKVLAYETLSETGFGLESSNNFEPNYYVDIEDFLSQKIEAMKLYSSEMGTFPFPRSEIAIRALAQLRGSYSGFVAAEAFELIRAFEKNY